MDWYLGCQPLGADVLHQHLPADRWLLPASGCCHSNVSLDPLPIVISAGFDPYWFAVVLTINMEIGLISPPVGLNLYVINGIAPDIKLKTILVGSIPYVL